MRKLTRMLTAILLCLCLLPAGSGAYAQGAAEGETRLIRVIELTGACIVERAGETLPAAADMALLSGDVIETPEGGAVNVNGVKDEELVKLAQDMRQTEPGDLISYCRKWIAFLEKFAETEPIIPVYSNVYYDFHPEVLREYKINQFTAWSEAIVGSYFSDVPALPAEEAELMD